MLRLCSTPCDQTRHRLPRSLTRNGYATGRRLVARKQPRLVEAEPEWTESSKLDGVHAGRRSASTASRSAEGASEWVGLFRLDEGVLVVPGVWPSLLLESSPQPPRGALSDARRAWARSYRTTAGDLGHSQVMRSRSRKLVFCEHFTMGGHQPDKRFLFHVGMAGYQEQPWF